MRRTGAILPYHIFTNSYCLCVLLLMGLSVTACHIVHSKSNPNIKQYDMKGRVEFVDQKNSGLTVAHEDIPGFMPAMTMLFKVKDKAALGRLAVGDQIKAVLGYNAQTRETWLQDIAILQKSRGGK